MLVDEGKLEAGSSERRKQRLYRTSQCVHYVVFMIRKVRRYRRIHVTGPPVFPGQTSGTEPPPFGRGLRPPACGTASREIEHCHNSGIFLSWRCGMLFRGKGRQKMEENADSKEEHSAPFLGTPIVFVQTALSRRAHSRFLLSQ